jgi:hypothetical protein
VTPNIEILIPGHYLSYREEVYSWFIGIDNGFEAAPEIALDVAERDGDIG